MKVSYPNYENSILNVVHTILDHYQVKARYPLIPELQSELAKNYKHVSLILLDGMGINIIEKHLAEDSFIRQKIVKKITSVFPPTTVAATNTVLTTNPPYQSGYLGWVQYFKKEDSNVVVFKNNDFYDEGRTFQNNLREMYLNQDLIYDYITQASPDVKTYELFPDFRPNGFKTFHLQMKNLRNIAKKNERNFSYVYWNYPDELEHEVGIDDLLVKVELDKLGKELEEFYENMNEDTLVIVIADHGLINVEPIDLYKNKEIMELLLRKPSLEPRAANFFVKPAKIDIFKTLFNETYKKDYLLMSKQDFLKSGLLGQGIKHPLLDSFLGDFIAVAISDKYFRFKSGSSFKGHHAGLLKGEMEVPLIMLTKKI